MAGITPAADDIWAGMVRECGQEACRRVTVSAFSNSCYMRFMLAQCDSAVVAAGTYPGDI